MLSCWNRLIVSGAAVVALAIMPDLSAQSGENSGAHALKRAAQVAEEAKGLEGDDRDQALQRAGRAYREVVAEFSADDLVSARAWFEIGEVERRLSNLVAAVEAYGKAIDLDGNRYGVRALLEKAHMHRRLAQWDAALAAYREVVAKAPDSARAHSARLWVGGCLQSTGDLGGAIKAFTLALVETKKPSRVIELSNKLAKALISNGDLDAAAAAIAKAEAVVPSGDGADVKRLRKASSGMSARKALQRARDKAAAAHGDAAQFEADRAGK